MQVIEKSLKKKCMLMYRRQKHKVSETSYRSYITKIENEFYSLRHTLKCPSCNGQLQRLHRVTIFGKKINNTTILRYDHRPCEVISGCPKKTTSYEKCVKSYIAVEQDVIIEDTLISTSIEVSTDKTPKCFYPDNLSMKIITKSGLTIKYSTIDSSPIVISGPVCSLEGKLKGFELKPIETLSEKHFHKAWDMFIEKQEEQLKLATKKKNTPNNFCNCPICNDTPNEISRIGDFYRLHCEKGHYWKAK
ncbi:MAG: hypothetical protein AB1420_15970 [Bacillota bacterium]